jgi:hypothetical protein
MILFKECAWLYQGCIQQKLLEMVPLWNGYVSTSSVNLSIISKRSCFGVCNEVRLCNGLRKPVCVKPGTRF